MIPSQRWTTSAGAAVAVLSGLAAEGLPEVEVVPLPPLLIAGQPARAHTQGLEIVAGAYYVTARREDVQPRRALLLRTAPGRPDWVCWDITPEQESGDASDAVWLDHPGGLQAGGGRLWLPLAESRRGGLSLIRAYDPDGLEPGQSARAAFEFRVNDQVGAVAVWEARRLLFGASWDTACVYSWDFEGKQEDVWSGAALAEFGLGIAPGPSGRSGLAVQDWKMAEDRLFASGLRRSGTVSSRSVESWLLSLPYGLHAAGEVRRVQLPEPAGTELGREGMAIVGGVAYFLPEDLGATNRLFRVPLVWLDLGVRTVFIQPVQR